MAARGTTLSLLPHGSEGPHTDHVVLSHGTAKRCSPVFSKTKVSDRARRGRGSLYTHRPFLNLDHRAGSAPRPSTASTDTATVMAAYPALWCELQRATSFKPAETSRSRPLTAGSVAGLTASRPSTSATGRAAGCSIGSPPLYQQVRRGREVLRYYEALEELHELEGSQSLSLGSGGPSRIGSAHGPSLDHPPHSHHPKDRNGSEVAFLQTTAASSAKIASNPMTPVSSDHLPPPGRRHPDSTASMHSGAWAVAAEDEVGARAAACPLVSSESAAVAAAQPQPSHPSFTHVAASPRLNQASYGDMAAAAVRAATCTFTSQCGCSRIATANVSASDYRSGEDAEALRERTLVGVGDTTSEPDGAVGASQPSLAADTIRHVKSLAPVPRCLIDTPPPSEIAPDVLEQRAAAKAERAYLLRRRVRQFERQYHRHRLHPVEGEDTPTLDAYMRAIVAEQHEQCAEMRVRRIGQPHDNATSPLLAQASATCLKKHRSAQLVVSAERTAGGSFSSEVASSSSSTERSWQGAEHRVDVITQYFGTVFGSAPTTRQERSGSHSITHWNNERAVFGATAPTVDSSATQTAPPLCSPRRPLTSSGGPRMRAPAPLDMHHEKASSPGVDGGPCALQRRSERLATQQEAGLPDGEMATSCERRTAAAVRARRRAVVREKVCLVDNHIKLTLSRIARAMRAAGACTTSLPAAASVSMMGIPGEFETAETLSACKMAASERELSARRGAADPTQNCERRVRMVHLSVLLGSLQAMPFPQTSGPVPVFAPGGVQSACSAKVRSHHPSNANILVTPARETIQALSPITLKPPRCPTTFAVPIARVEAHRAPTGHPAATVKFSGPLATSGTGSTIDSHEEGGNAATRRGGHDNLQRTPSHTYLSLSQRMSLTLQHHKPLRVCVGRAARLVVIMLMRILPGQLYKGDPEHFAALLQEEDQLLMQAVLDERERLASSVGNQSTPSVVPQDVRPPRSSRGAQYFAPSTALPQQSGSESTASSINSNLPDRPAYLPPSNRGDHIPPADAYPRDEHEAKTQALLTPRPATESASSFGAATLAARKVDTATEKRSLTTPSGASIFNKVLHWMHANGPERCWATDEAVGVPRQHPSSLVSGTTADGGAVTLSQDEREAILTEILHVHKQLQDEGPITGVLRHLLAVVRDPQLPPQVDPDGRPTCLCPLLVHSHGGYGVAPFSGAMFRYQQENRNGVRSGYSASPATRSWMEPEPALLPLMALTNVVKAATARNAPLTFHEAELRVGVVELRLLMAFMESFVDLSSSFSKEYARDRLTGGPAPTGGHATTCGADGSSSGSDSDDTRALWDAEEEAVMHGDGDDVTPFFLEAQRDQLLEWCYVIITEAAIGYAMDLAGSGLAGFSLVSYDRTAVLTDEQIDAILDTPLPALSMPNLPLSRLNRQVAYTTVEKNRSVVLESIVRLKGELYYLMTGMDHRSTLLAVHHQLLDDIKLRHGANQKWSRAVQRSIVKTPTSFHPSIAPVPSEQTLKQKEKDRRRSVTLIVRHQRRLSSSNRTLRTVSSMSRGQQLSSTSVTPRPLSSKCQRDGRISCLRGDHRKPQEPTTAGATSCSPVPSAATPISTFTTLVQALDTTSPVPLTPRISPEAVSPRGTTPCLDGGAGNHSRTELSSFTPMFSGTVGPSAEDGRDSPAPHRSLLASSMTVSEMSETNAAVTPGGAAHRHGPGSLLLQATVGGCESLLGSTPAMVTLATSHDTTSCPSSVDLHRTTSAVTTNSGLSGAKGSVRSRRGYGAGHPSSSSTMGAATHSDRVRQPTIGSKPLLLLCVPEHLKMDSLVTDLQFLEDARVLSNQKNGLLTGEFYKKGFARSESHGVRAAEMTQLSGLPSIPPGALPAALQLGVRKEVTRLKHATRIGDLHGQQVDHSAGVSGTPPPAKQRPRSTAGSSGPQASTPPSSSVPVGTNTAATLPSRPTSSTASTAASEDNTVEMRLPGVDPEQQWPLPHASGTPGVHSDKPWSLRRLLRRHSPVTEEQGEETATTAAHKALSVETMSHKQVPPATATATAVQRTNGNKPETPWYAHGRRGFDQHQLESKLRRQLPAGEFDLYGVSLLVSMKVCIQEEESRTAAAACTTTTPVTVSAPAAESQATAATPMTSPVLTLNPFIVRDPARRGGREASAGRTGNTASLPPPPPRPASRHAKSGATPPIDRGESLQRQGLRFGQHTLPWTL